MNIMNKCRNCDKNNSEGLFGSCTSTSDDQKIVWQISSEGFLNQDDQPRSRRPSNVDEKALLAIVENKPTISKEEIAK